MRIQKVTNGWIIHTFSIEKPLRGPVEMTQVYTDKETLLKAVREIIDNPRQE